MSSLNQLSNSGIIALLFERLALTDQCLQIAKKSKVKILRISRGAYEGLKVFETRQIIRNSEDLVYMLIMVDCTHTKGELQTVWPFP